LNLEWKRRGRAVLGDGTECVFDIYEAVLVWDGNTLTIPIDEADSELLVGMSLMEGYQSLSITLLKVIMNLGYRIIYAPSVVDSLHFLNQAFGL
jgi:predicted aspartyl protease